MKNGGVLSCGCGDPSSDSDHNPNPAAHRGNLGGVQGRRRPQLHAPHVRQRPGLCGDLCLPAEVRQGLGPELAEFQAFAGVADQQR